MRSRALPAVGISVAALVLTGFAGTASAASGPTAVAQSGGAAAVVGSTAACFSNVAGDSGVGITSQNFEASLDAYDNSGAADFTLKSKCKLKKVTAPGVYYNGAGPAASETVTIYKDKKGKPGKVKNTQTVKGADTMGSFVINLKKAKLKPGKYWVGVQANLDFAVGGQWGWETTNNQSGAGDMWQNPGGGFGTGCSTWGNMVTCLGAQGQGPDFMVQLN